MTEMHSPEDTTQKILKVAEMLRLDNPAARVHFTNTVSQMLVGTCVPTQLRAPVARKPLTTS